jgi:perosamine synthetase
VTLRIPLSSPDIGESEIEAVSQVLRTPELCLGPQLAAFEAALADYHSVPHAVAVSSGTAGLHLALLAQRIGQGHEVIVPSFTFIAVGNAVIQAGATPVFVEIDPVTLNLDPAAVERAVTPRTRAVLVVHTFGVPAQMDEIQSIVQRYGLALIEDASEAIGAEFGGQRVGSFGDFAVFGFYPNKQITTGEGGAVLARDEQCAARLRSLRNQGRLGTGQWLDYYEMGYNYRISEMACALGRVQLGRIEEILGLRRAAAERYAELLGRECGALRGLVVPPLQLPRCTISWFTYVVRLPVGIQRDLVRASLAREGIATGSYFGPIHMQPAWQRHPSVATCQLPITESIARRTLALPFFTRITAEQQQQVATALRRAV